MVFCQQSAAEHRKDHAENKFQKEPAKLLSLKINASLKSLGTTISDSLGQQHHHHNQKSTTEDVLSVAAWAVPSFLTILVQFWRAATESILVSSITVCFFRSKTRMLWVNSSSEITGCHLSSVEVLYTMRASNKAQKISLDLSHPGHQLFTFRRMMEVHMYKNYPS